MRDRQEPAPDKPTGGPRKRKDTRRWCKGVIGREHVPEIVHGKWAGGRPCKPRPVYMSTWLYGPGPWMCNHQESCSVCGKVSQYMLNPEQCPDRPTNLS